MRSSDGRHPALPHTHAEVHIAPCPAPSDGTLDELLAVWEQSVRSSHRFLTEADLDFFRPRVRGEYLPAVELFVVRSAAGRIAAFMGLSAERVEMLFVLPEEQGKGYGRALLEYAFRERRIVRVDANEDNVQAVRFYRHAGYRIVGHDATDPSGRPFPILHLQRRSDDEMP